MSSIPLPALQVQPPAGPMQRYARLLQLRQMLQEAPVQQQYQQGQLKLQQQQIQENENQLRQSQLFRQAFQDSGGDLDKTAESLLKTPGVDPAFVYTLQSKSAELKAKRAQESTAALNLRSTQIDNLAGLFKPLYDMPADADPQQLEGLYQQLRGRALQHQAAYGVTDASQLPEHFPGKDVGQFYMTSMQAESQQLKAEQARRAAAQAEETKRHNQTVEAQAAKPKPGVDVPYSPAVLNQKVAIATAGARARDAAQQPDIEAAARALIDPHNMTALNDVASMRGDMRLKIYNRAKQLDPNFDAGLVKERQHFIQQYENPAGRAAINRQSINNILQHAGDLSQLNQQYRRSNVRVLNTPLNAIARQFGDQVYTQFSTTNSVLKDELSLYFAGGYVPSADQQRTWNKIQSDEATPAQTEAFAKEVVHLGLRRAATFNSQFRKMMGYDDPNMISPEAKAAAESLGMGKEVAKFGSGGGYYQGQAQGGATAEPTATGPNGHKIAFRNGRWVDAQTGAPIQ